MLPSNFIWKSALISAGLPIGIPELRKGLAHGRVELHLDAVGQFLGLDHLRVVVRHLILLQVVENVLDGAQPLAGVDKLVVGVLDAGEEGDPVLPGGLLPEFSQLLAQSGSRLGFGDDQCDPILLQLDFVDRRAAPARAGSTSR